MLRAAARRTVRTAAIGLDAVETTAASTPEQAHGMPSTPPAALGERRYKLLPFNALGTRHAVRRPIGVIGDTDRLPQDCCTGAASAGMGGVRPTGAMLLGDGWLLPGATRPSSRNHPAAKASAMI
jgi:hypothetical protein